MKIGFIPIDNRPVSYDLPLMTSHLCNDVEFCMPETDIIGGLTKPADIDKIFCWLENLNDIDIYIVSLDTIAYGGLVQSRRSVDDLTNILQRLERLKNIIKGKKVLAFSSIMRISNNNFNVEEKPYWDIWGKKIFEYSYNFHKNGSTKTDVPKEILTDYLNTRKRNFEINKLYLDWQKEGIFDELIFSKDDCSEYGLNIIEANEIKSLGGFVKTGADEIPLLLLAKCFKEKIKICLEYTETNEKNLMSNYEDISIENCVKNQIETCDCCISEENNADIKLFINNFIKNQGEIVMKINTEPFNKDFTAPDSNFAIADVRFTNGSDNSFVEKILPYLEYENFIGYSGWNTSANTLGSLISQIKVYFYAQKQKKLNTEIFKKLKLTRILDDWAYQANVRQKLNSPDEKTLNTLMKPYEEKLQKILKTNYKIKYSFPWHRLFEVKIEFI